MARAARVWPIASRSVNVKVDAHALTPNSFCLFLMLKDDVEKDGEIASWAEKVGLDCPFDIRDMVLSVSQNDERHRLRRAPAVGGSC